MARKLSDAQADDLVRRYQAGETMVELAPIFGISTRVITDYLRRAGVESRPRHHGVVSYMASLSHEERSALTSRAMRKRWANASESDRQRMLKPAHDAVRGKPRPEEVLERIAATRAKKAESGSAYESQVANWLKERGIQFRQQAAIGRYNVDFAIGNVAVEITTGWARKKDWYRRTAYLFDHGWSLYFIWHDTRVPLLPAVTDDLVSWLKVLESSPSIGCQYRVIWRSTKVLASGGANVDEVAAILKSATPLR